MKDIEEMQIQFVKRKKELTKKLKLNISKIED